jgi:hypothetical protein
LLYLQTSLTNSLSVAALVLLATPWFVGRRFSQLIGMPINMPWNSMQHISVQKCYFSGASVFVTSINQPKLLDGRIDFSRLVEHGRFGLQPWRKGRGRNSSNNGIFPKFGRLLMVCTVAIIIFISCLPSFQVWRHRTNQGRYFKQCEIIMRDCVEKVGAICEVDIQQELTHTL